MTRSLFFGAVIGLLFLALPGAAWGCKCAPVAGAPPEGSPEDIAASLVGDEFVFAGKVRWMPPRLLLYLRAVQYRWRTRGSASAPSRFRKPGTR